MATFLERIHTLSAGGAQHASHLTNGNEYEEYLSETTQASAPAGGGLPEVINRTRPSLGRAVANNLQRQQDNVNVSREQMAQSMGRKASDMQESVNSVNATAENKKSGDATSGSLKRQHDSLKDSVTKSIPRIGASATALGTTGLIAATAHNNRSKHVEGIIKDASNALASTTLDKATGTEVDQKYEGKITQAKFLMFQAGSTFAAEAPVLRNSAKLLILQGSLLLSEGDALDYRGRWSHTIMEESWGLVTKNFHTIARDEAILSGKTSHIYGQEKTIIADKKKVVIKAEEVVISGGGALIRMAKGKIDLNPTIKLDPDADLIVIRFEDKVNIEMDAKPGVAPGKLPAQGPRNPVPCAVPTRGASDD